MNKPFCKRCKDYHEPCPTPNQIAASTARVRRDWTDEDFQRRSRFVVETDGERPYVTARGHVDETGWTPPRLQPVIDAA